MKRDVLMLAVAMLAGLVGGRLFRDGQLHNEATTIFESARATLVRKRAEEGPEKQAPSSL